MVFARVGVGDNTHVRAIRGHISSVPDFKMPDFNFPRSCFKRGYVNFLKLTSKFWLASQTVGLFSITETFSVPLSESRNEQMNTRVRQMYTNKELKHGHIWVLVTRFFRKSMPTIERSCSKKMFFFANKEE